MIRRELRPAMAGSVLLHGLVAAALMLNWSWNRELKTGAVVPVNIVSKAPDPDVRPAEQAPTPQEAQTETPTPEAPLQASPPPTPAPTPPTPQPKTPPPKPAPTPAPTPTPTPKPAPTPKPTPTPTPKPAPTPAPKTPPAKTPPAKTPPKPSPAFDLDALAADLSKSSKSPPRPSSATRGPSRPETATQARDTKGAGTSGSAVAGMQDELQRRWNPNCEVEGGRDVLVRVVFRLGPGGQVIGEPQAEIRSARTPVAIAAADRAVRAVYAASPFRTLPRDYFGPSIAVNFNAREACS